MPFHRLLAVVAAVAAIVALVNPARADFQITVGSVTVAAGSATTVDVLIAGGPQLLDNFSAEFRLTPVNAAAGFVRFGDPQANGQLGAPNYVFAGDSTNGPGTAFTTTFTLDTYRGGDGTLSGEG